MGAKTGNYSRNLFDENKRYVQRSVQQGIPWVDADDNDLQQGHYTMLRRVQQLLGNGSVRNGFKCVGTGAVNDFTVMGGGGTAETAGRFFVEGHGCLLFSDTSYKNDGAVEDGRSLHPRITHIEYQSGSNTTLLVDSAANWDADEHQGKVCTPDITHLAASFVVQSNTQTQMVLNGDATSVAQVGNHYRIELKTPVGADRIDGVFLNVYVDEYDCTDDPNLRHNLSTQVCAQLRMKLIQNVYVKEGSEVFPSYTDSDGNRHFTFQIARLHRKDGQDTINPPDVDDIRPPLVTDDDDGTGLVELMRLFSNLRPVTTKPASNFVTILPGYWTVSDRSRIRRLNVPTNSPPIPGVTTGGVTRYDLISITDTGVIHRKAGTQVASPGNPYTQGPAPDQDKLALAYIRVDQVGTPTITSDRIIDVREWMNLGGGNQHLQAVARYIYNHTNPANPFPIANDPSNNYILVYKLATNDIRWETQSAAGITEQYVESGMSVGDTVVGLPWTYTQGANNLIVFRNGLFQVLGTGYTETENNEITVSPAIESTSEEIVVIKIG